MSWRFITIPISIVFLQFVALTLESELRGDLYSEWQLWKRLLHKRYPSADVDRNRFSSWAANLYRVTCHNARYGEGREFYSQEMNYLTDHSAEEWLQLLPREHSLEFYNREINPVQMRRMDLPNEVNWVIRKWVSGSMSKGISPDGWAYSAIEAVQAQKFNVTGIHSKLSFHEIVECVKKPRYRPLMNVDAFSYILKKGVAYHTYYGGSCSKGRPSTQKFKLKIHDYHLLEPEDEENLKAAVAMIGPISVGIKVTKNFFFYKHGVFYDQDCMARGSAANHAVLLVGYGTDRFAGNFWTIQNNWGLNWGENGFARVARSSLGNCGMDSNAIYPVL